MHICDSMRQYSSQGTVFIRNTNKQTRALWMKTGCLLYKLHETRQYVVWEKSGTLNLNSALHMLLTMN